METNLYYLVYRDDTKIAPKKLPDANIAKYYLLKLTMSLSRQKGRDSSLIQKRGKKNVNSNLKFPTWITVPLNFGLLTVAFDPNTGLVDL